VSVKKPKKSAFTRRVPLQDRSRLRVERILDAASHVFAAVGYEAATTEAIAARAGTSIGSLYQFFPNKGALFEAIGTRYLEQVRAGYETLMHQFFAVGAKKLPWTLVLDTFVDAFHAFHRQNPGFRAVWTNWRQSMGVLEAGDALNREFARRTETVLAIYAKKLTPKRRPLVATLVVETLSAMLIVAARYDDDDRSKQIMDETKVLVRRYLEPYAT